MLSLKKVFKYFCYAVILLISMEFFIFSIKFRVDKFLRIKLIEISKFNALSDFKSEHSINKLNINSLKISWENETQIAQDKSRTGPGNIY